MRKVVLYIAASLDGYIADRAGGVGWLGGDGSAPDAPGSYGDFIKTVDTVIFGYTTYHQIVTELTPGAWDYADKQSYVLTHRQIENRPGITFTGESPAALVKRLKGEAGGDIWVCGGASVIGQLLQDDLIDRLCLNVMPILLGQGVRLFPEREGALKLKLIGTKIVDGVVDLWYERRGGE